MNNINTLNPSKIGIHGQREIFHVAEIYTSIQFGNKSSIVMVACLWYLGAILPELFILPPSSSNLFFFFLFSFSSFFHLLDLVRPFLDLVRPDSVCVIFIFQFFKGSISKSTDIESNLRPSLFPSNSSSPSLSIPPELFEISRS